MVGETHVAGPDTDSLVNHVHAWDDHSHLPRPLKTQDVRLLRNREQRPPEDWTYWGGWRKGREMAS